MAGAAGGGGGPGAVPGSVHRPAALRRGAPCEQAGAVAGERRRGVPGRRAGAGDGAGRRVRPQRLGAFHTAGRRLRVGRGARTHRRRGRDVAFQGHIAYAAPAYPAAGRGAHQRRPRHR